MSDPPKAPPIEFDLPEELKGAPADEPPTTSEAAPINAPPSAPASPPVVFRSLLDKAALTAAQTSPARRLIEQEQERVRRMRELTGGGAFQDMIARLREQDDALRRAMAGLDLPLASQAVRDLAGVTSSLAQIQTFKESPFFKQVLVDVEQARALHRAALGPLADLRSSGALQLFDNGAFAEALSGFEKRFVLPDMSALSEIMRQAAGIGSQVDLRKLAAGLQQPWLDVGAQMRSLAGFAELQTLGLTVRSLPPFAEMAGINVRAVLGDWRDEVTWPSSLDLGARSAFYVERGFRSEVTDFPAAAFEESLGLAGLGDADDAEAPDGKYADLHVAEGDVEWSAFVRTNEAHMLLMMFEWRLRRFINEVMSAAFGENWPKHKLPNGMLDRWLEKRERAEKEDRPVQHVIAYADFTDYSLILTKRDVWPVFAPFFNTQESVRESFNRLYLPRIEVSHARPISQDDDLYLRVEIKRLRRAFKVKSS